MIKVLEIYRERCSTLMELAQDIVFIYQDFTAYGCKLSEKQFKQEAKPVLEAVVKAFGAVSVWRAAALHYAITHVEKSRVLVLAREASHCAWHSPATACAG